MGGPVFTISIQCVYCILIKGIIGKLFKIKKSTKLALLPWVMSVIINHYR